MTTQEAFANLICAINFYVSTGDEFGTGMGYIEGDDLVTIISVNPNNATDVEDFEKFKAALQSSHLMWQLSKDDELTHGFAVYILRIARGQVTNLAAELLENPRKGWGSGEALITKTFPHLKEKIIKLEFGGVGHMMEWVRK